MIVAISGPYSKLRIGCRDATRRLEAWAGQRASCHERLPARTREYVLVAAILAVGAFVRFYRLDMTWFYVDQVRDVSVAADIVGGRSFPVVGPGIGGASGHLGPLYFYLIALPFFFTGNVLAGPVFVVLLNLAAVFLLYRFARDFLGAEVALTASALFAVFPPAVLSSRVLWNPGLLPFFTVLFIWALGALVVHGRSDAIVGVLALLAALTQLHLMTVPLVGVVIAALALLRPRVRVRHVAVGLVVALLLYAPYLVYECNHGFENLRAFVGAIGADQRLGGPQGWPTVVENLLLLFRPILSGFLVEQAWSPTFWAIFSTLYAFESALFALGVFVCVRQVARGWRRPTLEGIKTARLSVVLLLWLGIPVVVLGLRRTVAWWYYLDVLYPAHFVLAGVAVSTLRSFAIVPSGARAWLPKALSGVVVGLVLSQAAFQVGLQRRIAQQGEVVFDTLKFRVGPDTSGFGALAALFDAPKQSIGSETPIRPVLVSVPLGYRKEILEVLHDRLGVDRAAFWRRVHGDVLGLPEENEYLVRQLGSAGGERMELAGARTSHYLVVKASTLEFGRIPPRAARIGPYAIVDYHPLIDYGSWSYEQAEGGGVNSARERDWRRAELPWAGIAGPLLRGGTLRWRGVLRVPQDRRVARVRVTVIGERPIERLWMEVDGRPAAPTARSFAASPWLYWRTTGVWDLEGLAPETDRAILFGLEDTGHVMGVDVYEDTSG